MINRKNKMLAGILTLVLVLVVGYALFSETLSISGTASAQGKFDLTYECVGQAGGAVEFSYDEENNSVTTTSMLKMPTDAASFIIKITNTGTIPVKLKTVDSPNNVSASNFKVAGDETYFDESTFLQAYYIVFPEMDSNNSPVGSPIQGDQAVLNANIEIQPGQSIGVGIAHYWTDSEFMKVSQPALPEGGATMNYNLKFGFEQASVK